MQRLFLEAILAVAAALQLLPVGVSALSATSSITTTSEMICGQRCLWIRHRDAKEEESPSSSSGRAPPLIVLPGMAQTVNVWEHLARGLVTNERNEVLVYQAMGLGREIQETKRSNNGENEDVSLPAQAARLLETIQTAFPGASAVDLAGFSLGGRIALAAACLQAESDNVNPVLLRKLHLSGVSMERSDYGYLQLLQWKDHLQQNNLRAFAWAAMTATYSPSFLRKNGDRISTWIQSVCDNQSVEGLLALMEQTHDDDSDSWSVESMAKRLLQRQSSSSSSQEQQVQGRLLVGELDEMAPCDSVQALADMLQWPCRVVPAVGHAVAMEAPRMWLDDVMDHLSN